MGLWPAGPTPNAPPGNCRHQRAARTHLLGRLGRDELRVDLQGLGAQLRGREGELVLLAAQPELQVLLAVLRPQEGPERRQPACDRESELSPTGDEPGAGGNRQGLSHPHPPLWGHLGPGNPNLLVSIGSQLHTLLRGFGKETLKWILQEILVFGVFSSTLSPRFLHEPPTAGDRARGHTPNRPTPLRLSCVV